MNDAFITQAVDQQFRLCSKTILVELYEKQTKKEKNLTCHSILQACEWIFLH